MPGYGDMRRGREITSRGFLAVIPKAVATGLLGSKALANAQRADEEIGLGRLVFDHSFEWDKDGGAAQPRTQEEYAALINIGVGEFIRLELYEEGCSFRSESVYPRCKLISETGASWHGLLYD